jgi:hypothetical protein
MDVVSNVAAIKPIARFINNCLSSSFTSAVAHEDVSYPYHRPGSLLNKIRKFPKPRGSCAHESVEAHTKKNYEIT